MHIFKQPGEETGTSGPGGQLSGLSSGRRGWAERGEGIPLHHHGGKRVPEVQGGQRIGCQLPIQARLSQETSLSPKLCCLAWPLVHLSSPEGQVGLIPVDVAPSNTHTPAQSGGFTGIIPALPDASSGRSLASRDVWWDLTSRSSRSWRRAWSLWTELCRTSGYAPIWGPDHRGLSGRRPQGRRSVDLTAVLGFPPAITEPG